MTAAARFAAEREGKAKGKKRKTRKRIRSNKLSLMQRQKRTEKSRRGGKKTKRE